MPQLIVVGSNNQLFTSYTTTSLNTLRKNPFKNITGKGKNAGEQDFPSPQCFLLFQQQISV